MHHPDVLVSSKAQIAQGVLTAITFSLLLAGSNAITPLLPLYRGLLAFDPLMLTLTFVSYVTVLIIILLIFSKPGLTRWAPLTVCTALLGAIAADFLLASATEVGILAGRAMTGVACGLGTGSASALVVCAMGAKGRSISATGNLVGAVAGTVGAQCLVYFFPDVALHRTFDLHALACALLLILLVPILSVRRTNNAQALSPAGDVAVQPVKQDFLANQMAIVIGCIAWIFLSLSIVLLPTYFAERDMTLVSHVGIIVFLICSAMAQVASNRIRQVLPQASGVLSMSLGSILILTGSLLHIDIAAALGFATLGAGAGLSYRLSLVVIAKGASPAKQGAIASFYAAITYAAAAICVLMAGILGNVIGIQNMVVSAFIVLTCISALLITRAPRLKDTTS